MFQDFRKYHWVLKTYEYPGLDELLLVLDKKIIVPAEVKAKEIEGVRRAWEDEIANERKG